MKKNITPSPFVLPKLKTHEFQGRAGLTVVDSAGAGSFGQLHLLYQRDTRRMAVAKSSRSKEQACIQHQYRVLKQLEPLKCECLPRVWALFPQSGGTLLMEALGPNLASLRKHGQKLPLSTVSRVGADIFQAIRALLQCDLVHRDIKPDNILQDMRKGFKLIDFGLCVPLPYRKSSRLAGSARYACLSAHSGSWGRSSDLESLLYVMVQAAKGFLPWELRNSQQIGIERLWEDAANAKELSAKQLIGDELLKGPKRVWWNALCSLLDYARGNQDLQPSIVTERLAFLKSVSAQ